MNEWLILLWIFAAAIVACAVIALVAHAAALAEGIYLDTRAAYRRHRRRALAARLERRVARGEREIARELVTPPRDPGPASAVVELHFIASVAEMSRFSQLASQRRPLRVVVGEGGDFPNGFWVVSSRTNDGARMALLLGRADAAVSSDA